MSSKNIYINKKNNFRLSGNNFTPTSKRSIDNLSELKHGKKMLLIPFKSETQNIKLPIMDLSQDIYVQKNFHSYKELKVGIDAWNVEFEKLSKDIYQKFIETKFGLRKPQVSLANNIMYPSINSSERIIKNAEKKFDKICKLSQKMLQIPDQKSNNAKSDCVILPMIDVAQNSFVLETKASYKQLKMSLLFWIRDNKHMTEELYQKCIGLRQSSTGIIEKERSGDFKVDCIKELKRSLSICSVDNFELDFLSDDKKFKPISKTSNSKIKAYEEDLGQESQKCEKQFFGGTNSIIKQYLIYPNRSIEKLKIDIGQQTATSQQKFDIKSRNSLTNKKVTIEKIQISPDDKFVYINDSNYRLLKFLYEKKSKLEFLSMIDTTDPNNTFRFVILTKDGDFLFISYSSGRLTKWSTQNQQQIFFYERTSCSPIECIVINYHQKIVYTCNGFNYVYKWKSDLTEKTDSPEKKENLGKEIFDKEPSQGIYLMVINETTNENLIGCNRMGNLLQFRISKYGEKLVKNYGIVHQRGITTILFTKKEDEFLTGDRGGIIKLWSLKSQKILKSIDNYPAGVTTMLITNNDELLFIGRSDGQVKLFKFKKMKFAENIQPSLGPIKSIQFSS